jgi:uncharacterized membrane protein
MMPGETWRNESATLVFIGESRRHLCWVKRTQQALRSYQEYMDVELPHLLFRWLHVLSAVMWVGQIWALAVVLPFPPDRSADPGVAPMILRAHKWMRGAANLTLITGVGLLGIVYYGGGALTTPTQSAGLAMGIGFTLLFAGSIVYDGLWRLLRRQPLLAGLISLVLVAGAAVWLNRIMTGRAVFIHIGAMLAMIMGVNVEQRIWPVERRRLSATPTTHPPSMQAIETAALRLRHNAGLAIAVILFMLSNHFPLVYGSAPSWLAAPAIILTGWLLSRLFYLTTRPAGNLSHRTAS